MDFRKLNHQNLTNLAVVSGAWANDEIKVKPDEAKHEVGYLQSDPDEYIKNAFTAVDKNK